MEREQETYIADEFYDESSRHSDAVTPALSHRQSEHRQLPFDGPQPQRGGITPRFLDSYYELDSHAGVIEAADALHIIWVTLADGTIADMPSWRSYTGQNRAQVKGEGWLDAIHPDDRQRVGQLWAQALRTRTIFQTWYRVRRRDGIYRTFDVRCVPVLRTTSGIQEWVWNCSERRTEQRDDQVAPFSGDTSRSHATSATSATSVPPASQSAPLPTTTKGAVSGPQALMVQLIPVFEAMADAVVVYDTAGHPCFLNTAARALFTVDASDDPATIVTRLTVSDAQGHPFAAGHSPIARILEGEALSDAEAEQAMLTLSGGRIARVRISGAPLHDTAGQPSGAVVILREQQELLQAESDAREALGALLALAEAVIFVSDEADGVAEHHSIEGPSASGQRLAALACSVIGCRRVGILAVAPENETLHPMAVAGLDEADERAWWNQLRHAPRLDAVLDRSVINRLRADQVLLIDQRQPPYDQRPNPYGITTMLVVPMLVGDQLIGIVTLDYNGAEHAYALEEIALAGAVAKLAGLVIERERLQRERADAQANVLALREAKRRMDEFLGIASHELRTPLTVIKANVQLIARRVEQAEATEQMPGTIMSRLRITPDFLNRTLRQVDRLDRLVSDMLDVSRIEAGRLVLRCERMDLRTVAHDAVEEQRAAWADRVITLDLPSASVLVDVDPDRIGQVITNYLTNALKYSPVEQPVVVSVALQSNRAHIAVRDYGPGLSDEQCEHLWERFHRVSGIEVQSGSGVGLGLGLHISKTIVERHGGTTGLESAPGEGSSFWFTLPLAESYVASGIVSE